MRRIFHLSIPVNDLELAQSFYTNVLDAKTGRQESGWADILLWGHQITLQHCPSEVASLGDQGKRHFGVVLPWSEWAELADRLNPSDDWVLGAPAITREGDPGEQAKIHLKDPSNNVIEIKAYRNVADVLGLSDAGY